MLSLRLSRTGDIADLTPRLRKADLEEIAASGWENPSAPLWAGYVESQPCYSIVDASDRPVAVFGVVPSGDPEVGYVWFLGSDDIQFHRSQFLRRCREVLDNLHQKHPLLTNAVYSRNEVHIKWLRWLGFSFLRALKKNGQPFYEFARINHV